MGNMTDTGAHLPTIKVVIVDDHELVRGGLETILGLFDDITLVGEAESGAAAIRLCVDAQPDVVLMDLVMPGGMDGAEATQEIIRTCPHAKVLALTSFSDPELIQRVLRAGALGLPAQERERQGACRGDPQGERGHEHAGAGGGRRARPRHLFARRGARRAHAARERRAHASWSTASPTSRSPSGSS